MRTARRLTYLIVLIACAHIRAHTQFYFSDEQPRTIRVSDALVVCNFEADPARFETHLVITDVEGSGAVVNVLLYDTEGALADQQAYFLPMFGKVNYNPADRLGSRHFRGTIQILADGGAVAAQFWQFMKETKNGAFNTAVPAQPMEGSRALLCQHFVSAPGIDARLVLVNPNGDSAATVAVTFYLDTGKQLSKSRHPIPPNGMIVIDPFKENEGMVRTGLAYCEVLTGGRIVGEYWQSANSDREQYQVSLPVEAIPVRKANW
jgi:hypothetical protein